MRWHINWVLHLKAKLILLLFIVLFDQTKVSTEIQYSGYTFALRYCYSEFYKLNPVKAKEKIRALKQGVLNNLFEISEFWILYKNPIEPIIKKGYDSYLKANGQSKGLKSYNDMVGLVVAYLEKESK